MSHRVEFCQAKFYYSVCYSAFSATPAKAVRQTLRLAPPDHWRYQGVLRMPKLGTLKLGIFVLLVNL